MFYHRDTSVPSLSTVCDSPTHSSALRHCLPDCLVRAKHKPHQAACPARDSCVHEFTRHALKAAHDSRFSCVSLNTELPNSLSRCSDPPCSPPRSPLSKLPRSVLLTAPSLLTSASLQQMGSSWPISGALLKHGYFRRDMIRPSGTTLL